MKRVSLLLVLALLGLLVAAPAVQAAPPTTAFTGHWAAPDPADGSNLDLYVFGGTNAQLMYTDDAATFACDGLSDQAWTSFLTGRVDGNDLFSIARWTKCGKVPRGAGFSITWTLHDQGDNVASNDVLTNDFPGEEYHRVP